MDADREREIRELAEKLSRSNRHRRVARVLHELLYEIDLLREDVRAPMTMGDALAIIEAYEASSILEGRGGNSWREAVLVKQGLYSTPPSSKGVS